MILPATPQAIADAASALRAGRLVAFPTETVYGLGADASNTEALKTLFAVKRRPADHPVIVHILQIGSLSAWARSLPAYAKALAEAFWPGPLTLILPRADKVSTLITGGQDSVGVRVPAHAIAQALLREFAKRGGAGIAAPSANRFGRISATTAEHVATEFANEVALILDGGSCQHGIESTIVDCTGSEAALLRPGAIGLEQLTRVLGRAPSVAGALAPRVSGSLASHYAPRTHARLVPRADLVGALGKLGKPGAHIAVLAHSIGQPPSFEGTWFDAPSESAGYAQQLYANLRALDAREADEIWIEAPPDGPDWIAVNDRLRRATHRG